MFSIRAIFNLLSKSPARDPSIPSPSSSLVRVFSSISDGTGSSSRVMEDEAMDGSASDRFTAENPDHESVAGEEDDGDKFHKNPSFPVADVPLGGNQRIYSLSEIFAPRKSAPPEGYDHRRSSPADRRPENFENIEGSGDGNEAREQLNQGNFIEKLRLGAQKLKQKAEESSSPKTQDPVDPEAQPPDADEIFGKMKEAGLIPNAVSMLDGLCKDGLVHEAMNLFALMRQRGTLPEVVIYTAAVEGFCTARRLEDAKRIFRKMQRKGVWPNAFSYAVLVQGLCKGRRVEDAAGLCLEMVEAGHSPNVETFVGVVDRFCKTEGGVGGALSFIQSLTEKGYFVNVRAVGRYLDENGHLSPWVREAIFRKENSPEVS